MDLMSNGFGVGSGSENKDSISRYLGGNLGETGFGVGDKDSLLAGMDFSSILKSQLANQSAVDPKLNASLERLEAGQPLVNLSPDEVAKQIFAEIDKIMLGVNNLLSSFVQGSTSIRDEFQDLNRLIEGAKQLFDTHENPMVLEGLGDVWGDLKKKKSPAFHSVQNYFLHISIASTTSSTATTQPTFSSTSLDIPVKGESKQTYSSESFTLFYSVVSSLEESVEKDDILNAFDSDVLANNVETEFPVLDSSSSESLTG